MELEPEAKKGSRGMDLTEATQVCESLLGKSLRQLSFPGGRQRKTILATMEDGSLYAVTKRRKSNRAVLEEGVMRALIARGAPIPSIAAFADGWLIQEYVGGVRLSEKLNAATTQAEIKDWLLQGLDSLLAIQQAGRNAGLSAQVAGIGHKEGWLDRLMAMPEEIGQHLEKATPAIDKEHLASVLAVPFPAFIKWDARPGNAMVSKNNAISWIDWEHCGTRDPLDDMAWLLGDEWTPNIPELEAQLLDTYLPLFSEQRTADQSRDYLMTFGTLHMCVRLSLILSHKGDGTWWDRQRALAGDKIGVTADSVERLCQRAARWSAASPVLQSFSGWFLEIQDRLLENQVR